MTDEKGGDDKVLCRAGDGPAQAHLHDISDVSEFDRLEIQHFFEVYKDLEPGKSVEGAEWVGRDRGRGRDHRLDPAREGRPRPLPLRDPAPLRRDLQERRVSARHRRRGRAGRG